MEAIRIIGGAPLSGSIRVSGAKNNALKAIAATVMIPGVTILHNVPAIRDVELMHGLLTELGVVIESIGDHSFRYDARTLQSVVFTPQQTGALRSSVMLIAPMLHRFGTVTMAHPGGDVIGKRPIDLSLRGFEQFGVDVRIDAIGYHLQLNQKTVHPATVVFPWISHTGTEAMIMMAVGVAGETTIINAACEPEVTALAEMLNAAGASIRGAGTPTITISGGSPLHDCESKIIPDRIETGTFAALAAATRSRLSITHCEPRHLDTLWEFLQRMGIEVKIGPDVVEMIPSDRLTAIELRTHEYPGLATDMQPPLTVLLTQAEGLSMVHETIFEGRLFYTDLLNRMGATIIMCDPHRVLVHGPTPLYGRRVESPDIRAGMALVLAGLLAQGTTTIDHIHHIDRGYEAIVDRLQGIGANVERIQKDEG